MKAHGLGLSAIALAIATAVAGCSGGGATPPAPNPTAPPASTAISVGAGSASSGSVTAGPVAVAVGFPATSAGSGSITVTGSATLPPGVAPLLAGKRPASFPADATFAGYLALLPNASMTFPVSPSFTITLNATLPFAGRTFYIAYLAPGSSTWQEPALGPGSLTWPTLTFPSSNNSISLVGGSTYGFALYSVPSTDPTPTQAPTIGPSSSPGTTPTIAPTATPTVAPTATPTIAPTAAPTIAPTATPTIAPTATPTVAPTATPTPAAISDYVFAGPGDNFQFSGGGTGSLSPFGAYRNIGYTQLAWSQNLNPSGFNLGVFIATDNSDTYVNGVPTQFPVDNAVAGATPIIYYQFTNTAIFDLIFTTTPTIHVNYLVAIPGATCYLDHYGVGGGGYQWTTTGLTTQSAPNDVFFSAVYLNGGANLPLPAGVSYDAVSCK